MDLWTNLHPIGKKTESSCNIIVKLYWFYEARGSLPYKYDASNPKWMNVGSNYTNRENDISTILQVVCIG